MAIDQKLLLQAATRYDDSTNVEFSPVGSLVPVPKRRIFISHSLDSFRMVEGFIVLMRRAGIDAYFDWESGNMTDEFRHGVARDVKVRIAKADIFILLATEGSVNDESCARALEFASIINRRVYIAHTISGTTEWKINNTGKYNQLTIERSMKTIDKFSVKILEHRRRQLWATVGNASLL
jgi:hypothetical protein